MPHLSRLRPCRCGRSRILRKIPENGAWTSEDQGNENKMQTLWKDPCGRSTFCRALFMDHAQTPGYDCMRQMQRGY